MRNAFQATHLLDKDALMVTMWDVRLTTSDWGPLSPAGVPDVCLTLAHREASLWISNRVVEVRYGLRVCG